jgi:hypothetical protein
VRKTRWGAGRQVEEQQLNGRELSCEGQARIHAKHFSKTWEIKSWKRRKTERKGRADTKNAKTQRDLLQTKKWGKIQEPKYSLPEVPYSPSAHKCQRPRHSTPKSQTRLWFLKISWIDVYNFPRWSIYRTISVLSSILQESLCNHKLKININSLSPFIQD